MSHPPIKCCPECGSPKREAHSTIHTEYVVRRCENAWHMGTIPRFYSYVYLPPQ